jgi:hypothetical protein
MPGPHFTWGEVSNGSLPNVWCDLVGKEPLIKLTGTGAERHSLINPFRSILSHRDAARRGVNPGSFVDVSLNNGEMNRTGFDGDPNFPCAIQG